MPFAPRLKPVIALPPVKTGFAPAAAS